ncbi:MAG: histidine-type phosphatase [Muribaculaceae bacterium]|nr:histidine-type phosphatase [Muribaculaceae bacterium]
MKKYLISALFLGLTGGFALSSYGAKAPLPSEGEAGSAKRTVQMLPSAEEETDFHKLSGNLRAYPYVDNEPPAQTPPPAGYRPFHLEHYGRHGSRWLIGGNDYLIPVKNLEKAERAGKLTPLGAETLAALREIEKASHGRLGELSDKGALQHQAIGRRMARNYPELFTDSSFVDAKATVVIRCILSMLNGLQGIREVAPNVSTRSDASHADMYFMNYDDKPAWVIKDRAEETVLKDYREKHKLSGDYLSRLVTDPQFARDSVEPGLMPYLYWVLANTQGHTGQPWLLDKVLTADEAREAWRYDNGMWTLHCIDTPLTERRMPYTQRMLLKNIIESTDTAINSTRPSVNLRYGHDGILINFITLMELDDLGREFASIEEAEAAGLRSYDLIPMAGNIQLVFYRNDDGDVLVKALLNEREMRLPAEPVSGPYYRWNDLRDYYMKKIEPYL